MIENVILGLLIISTLTGLATEAVKKVLDDYHKTYQSNTLSGIIAVILSSAISAGYITVTQTPLTATVVVYVIAITFMSWLCSMVGYDKVVQTVSQFKMDRKDDLNE